MMKKAKLKTVFMIRLYPAIKWVGLLIIFFIIFSLYLSSGYAYWVWTPQSGKWINPKYTVRDTPKEQFDYGLEFYSSGDYKRAIDEFKRLIRHYPQSSQAAESQYYLGLCLEKLGKFYEAYLAYQRLIDEYPFSERIEEVVKREYEIGERFFVGEKRKVLGVHLPTENPCIEIFRKVIMNSPYSDYTPQAQYKIGLFLKEYGRFNEAKEEFAKVVANYPESEWAEAAKFQLALCTLKTSLKTEYDQEATQEAKKKFEDFVKAHPDVELSKKAEEELGELQNKEAESNFKTGEFYEKQKSFESARIYYRYVIEDYPQTRWASKARERLEAMEGK